jgi:hypothetical protein
MFCAFSVPANWSFGSVDPTGLLLKCVAQKVVAFWPRSENSAPAMLIKQV